MKTRTCFALLTMLLVGSMGILSGCSTGDQKQPGKDQSATKTDKPAEDTAATTIAATSTTTSTAAAPTTPAAPDAAKPATQADATAQAPQPGQIRVNLNELPDDVVICTVDGTPIKVADYRCMLRLQQAQVQGQLANNPLFRMTLAQKAQQAKVTLTADERNKLIEAAKAQHSDFKAFLKSKNTTEAQFNKEVEGVGLEFKVANALIESELLPQLVNREIMRKAALSAGLAKKAEAKYAQVKNNGEFKALQTQTGLSAATLKDELIKGELAKMQIEKIGRTVHVSDAEIRQCYNQNKSQLKHNERVRLACILVAAPEVDQAGVQSVRTQVKKAAPKLEGKELDAMVAQVMKQLENKALILLGEAKSPKINFAKLANENSDLVMARVKKNGGDMGWQEKQQLVPQLADVIWKMKPGTVIPQLIKTNEGFFIMKVVAHEKAGSMPLADVKDILEMKLKEDKVARAVQVWLAQQGQTVKIQYSPKFIALATEKSKTN